MNYTSPAPTQPTQPQAYTQPAPQAQVPNNVTFVADSKTVELLNVIHPELVTGLINIAIKKFAETSDFHDYFVKDEFKQILPIPQKEPQKNNEPQEAAPAATSTVDFASW